MPQKAGIWTYPTALFIREHLKALGEDYPMAMWRLLKAQRASVGLPCGNYDTFRNCIMQLKRLGLIEIARTAPSNFPGTEKHYYRLVKAHLSDSGWKNPRAALYPKSWRGKPVKP